MTSYRRFLRPIIIALVALLSTLGAFTTGFRTAGAALLDTSLDFSSFTGAGFASNPAAGQLDADSWSVLGLSDGDLLFGETQTGGDFARGIASGGIGTGGLYAFDTGGGNTILGIQPTGSDFTPGSLILRLRNDSGGPLSAVSLSYDIYYFNDRGRSTGLTLAYGTNGVDFTPVPAADFFTPEAAAATPTWEATARGETIAVAVPDQSLLYLRWTADDAGGSGSRDEIGLDNINLSGVTPTAVGLQRLAARTGVRPAGRAQALVGLFFLGGVTALVVVRRRRWEPFLF